MMAEIGLVLSFRCVRITARRGWPVCEYPTSRASRTPPHGGVAIPDAGGVCELCSLSDISVASRSRRRPHSPAIRTDRENATALVMQGTVGES